MTQSEFSDWLKYHSQAFRDLTGWFSNMSPADRDATLREHWFPCLESVEACDARAATDDMFRDETGKFAKLFEQTPATVRRVSRHHAAKRRRAETLSNMTATDDYDQPRYRCPICSDIGIVVIWNPKAVDRLMRRVVNGQMPNNWMSILYEVPRTTFGLPCKCASDEVAQKAFKGWKYDPARHCLEDKIHPEKIIEWWDQRVLETHQQAAF